MLQAAAFEAQAVLCFVRTDTEILLIEKLRGLGKGKINGPGGKLENGETYVEAAIRETQEEIGITPLNPQKRGALGFSFKDGYSLYGEVFVATEWTGTLIDTEEAIPFWCRIAEIPYSRMWADDIYWLPHVLRGSVIEGLFDFDNDAMLSARVNIR